MTRTARRVGIVLFQLGGPDTLEAIEPFLYNLFCLSSEQGFIAPGIKHITAILMRSKTCQGIFKPLFDFFQTWMSNWS